MRHCPYCGMNLTDDETICPNCMNPVDKDDPLARDASGPSLVKLVAGILFTVLAVTVILYLLK